MECREVEEVAFTFSMASAKSLLELGPLSKYLLPVAWVQGLFEF